MDFSPRMLWRMIQLGLKDDVLNSRVLVVPLDKGHFLCYNFLWGQQRCWVSRRICHLPRRHLTHRVFAKAMSSVWISGTEGPIGDS
jgi:hypothetical protein